MTTPDAPRPARPAPAFPPLTIISLDPPPTPSTPPPPPKSMKDKYGSFRYVGIAGLVVAFTLIGSFAWKAWDLRAIWARVYLVHDAARPEVERVDAAYQLARDPRTLDQQRWEMAMRRPLPPLARYVLAESLTSDIVRADPGLFAKYVALSEEWPDWLRLLGVRAMAVAASEGVEFPADLLATLSARPEPTVGLWVDYIRAVTPSADPHAADRLRFASGNGGDPARIAARLLSAIEAGSHDRSVALEKATLLLRGVTPDAGRIWDGWAERDGHLVRTGS